MMKKTLILLLVCFLGNISFAQESLYIAFLDCEGCDAQTGVSSTYILADFVNGYDKYKAQTAKKRDSSLQIENAVTARESAELLSAKYFIVGKVIRIEDQYFISVYMYATQSGLTVWKSSALTNDLNDLPVILDDFAAHLGEDKLFSKHGDVYRVYSGEGRKKNKMRANVGFGLSTNAFMFSDDFEKYRVIPGFGILLSFDIQRFIFQANFDHNKRSFNNINATPGVHVISENRYNQLTLNVLYPLRQTNSAPFISLGAGINHEKFNEEWRYSGFLTHRDPEYFQSYRQYAQVVGGIGYILKRNSVARLYIYGQGFAVFGTSNNADFGAAMKVALVVGN